MSFRAAQVLFVCWALLLSNSFSDAAEPRVLVEGATLELIASEPDIVTPVGMTFDSKGRLLVIESHTHQRPDGYEGPKGDRILMLSDSDGDGELDRWSTFAEGFQQSMNLLAKPSGGVYLVTRRSVDLLLDEDDDGQMDNKQPILRLETKENYPHNALSGIALDGEGGLLVGLGENFGAPYKLVGTDGSSYSDQGGVGTIFRCTADGKQVRRFCNGFWNPFSICRLPGGSVFTVDNDPDSSPPCRLIHAVESGDYGYRYEYSRAGIHPLQAWNGELPGTLPMLAGTGEAPCAVLPHRGYLWVTSWGDHRLERYTLSSTGGTYIAKQTIAVQGDTNFRPTGCAVAPDGSLYFSDWVSASYPVHGKGRIWRLSFEESAEQHQIGFVSLDSENIDSPARRARFAFHKQRSVLKQSEHVESPAYKKDDSQHQTVAGVRSDQALARAQAYRWSQKPIKVEDLRSLLFNRHREVRQYAIRWIADERMQDLRDDLQQLLESATHDGEGGYGGESGFGSYSSPAFVEIDQQEYLAILSAIEWLDGQRKLRRASLNDGLLVRELKNERRSPQLKALALQMTSPDNDYLTLEKIREYLQSEHSSLGLEAVRTLALQSNPGRFDLLAEIAEDAEQGEQARAEAIAGLAGSEEHVVLLTMLKNDRNRNISREARRVLRLMGISPPTDEQKPPADDLAAWNDLLAKRGDPAAGRRLFFSSQGARCAACHQYQGRGGKIGPDLTRIRHSRTREQLIASILQPSQEMAPSYQPWKLQTDDGRTLMALRLHKSGDGGTEVYVDSDGKEFQLRGDEIEIRQASEISIMPSGLEKTISIEQLRDLVDFLSVGN